jgi:hypothetical protein
MYSPRAHHNTMFKNRNENWKKSLKRDSLKNAWYYNITILVFIMIFERKSFAIKSKTI